MKEWFLYGGIALVLFSIWALARRDLPRLRGINRRVDARVVGHFQGNSDGARTYAAIYEFAAEGAEHRVTDEVYVSTPRPEVGAKVELTFPFGRPDLARPPRPLLRLWIYGVLLLMLAMLVAKAMGRLH